ncbi:MAG: hypothetical protein B7Z80_15435 [Rhodospirillales bacterium 20-64-7]|nr:MAG: hypothetical protein B7Z80_15435 [Rhodospirillales bacterium 20-64-7]
MISFIVITNNYRADSGGVARSPSDVILRAPDQTRDVIVRYILAEQTIEVATPAIWSFAPMGTAVVVTFESSPAAARFLLRSKNISALGDAGDGYAKFALTLS